MTYHVKYFCLKCHKTNACSCGTIEYQFNFHHILRPPKTLAKKKWRDFLDACPQFGNVVPEHLYPMFNEFILSVGYKKDKLNGRKFPLEIKKS